MTRCALRSFVVCLGLVITVGLAATPAGADPASSSSLPSVRSPAWLSLSAAQPPVAAPQNLAPLLEDGAIAPSAPGARPSGPGAQPPGQPLDGAAASCRLGDKPQWEPLRRQLRELVSTGGIANDAAQLLLCDPRAGLDLMTVSSGLIPGPTDMAATAAGGCRQSGRWWSEFSIAGITAGRHMQDLRWCYDGTRVFDWSGQCWGETTRWGTVNGWVWDGCLQPEFIPYVLNGRYPGGVHHRTVGNFEQKFLGVVNYQPRIDIWGHYDRTCDTNVNGKAFSGMC